MEDQKYNPPLFVMGHGGRGRDWSTTNPSVQLESDEPCFDCGAPVEWFWTELWESVIPPEIHDEWICVRCFSRRLGRPLAPDDMNEFYSRKQVLLDRLAIPYGECYCGKCGLKTTIAKKTNRRWGQLKGEPNRWYPGHQNKRTKPWYIEDSETGCWIWDSTPDRNGYGQMNVDAATMLRAETTSGKTMTTRPAHCVYYEETKGRIPEGLELHHLCGRRACVNPNHLKPVTHAENIRLSLLQGRYTKKLSWKIVREIRAEPKVYGSEIALARKYGVHPSTIRDVRNGKIWQEP